MIEVKSNAGSNHELEFQHRTTKVLLLMRGEPDQTPVAVQISEGDTIRRFALDSEFQRDLDLPEGWEDAARINANAFTVKLRYAFRVCVMA